MMSDNNQVNCAAVILVIEAKIFQTKIVYNLKKH